KPSEYLRQLYYDSMVFTPEGLRHLIAEVGAGQIVMGTDYPFPWTKTAVDHILTTPGLTDAARVAYSGRRRPTSSQSSRPRQHYTRPWESQRLITICAHDRRAARASFNYLARCAHRLSAASAIPIKAAAASQLPRRCEAEALR